MIFLLTPDDLWLLVFARNHLLMLVEVDDFEATVEAHHRNDDRLCKWGYRGLMERTVELWQVEQRSPRHIPLN